MQSVCDVWKQFYSECFFCCVSSLNVVLWTQFNSSPSDRFLSSSFFSGSFSLISFARAMRFLHCARPPYKSNFHTKLTSRFRYGKIRFICCRRHRSSSLPPVKTIRQTWRQYELLCTMAVLPVLSALNWCSSGINIVCKQICASYDNKCKTIRQRIKRLHVACLLWTLIESK